MQVNASFLLLIGGLNYKIGFRNHTYYYNIKTNKLAKGPQLNVYRYEHSCAIIEWTNPLTCLTEKSVTVVGGGNDMVKQLRVVEFLDPSNNQSFVLGPKLPRPTSSKILVVYNSTLILFDSPTSFQLSSPIGKWTRLNNTFDPLPTDWAFMVPDSVTTSCQDGSY